MGDVQRANVGAGATRVSSDNWLLNLTALTEGLQGVNLTEGVDIQGWVVNITAVIEDIPLSQYLPHYTAREWFQLVVTLVCVLLGTQWTITRYQKWRRAQKGWYFALRESKHARLILPPECVTEAPLRSPLIRGTKKVMRKILRKRRNGEYTGITSIDPSLLPEDSIPLLVFVNSRSGGQLGGYLFNQLAKNLNPLQVVDLYKTDPKVALRQFCDLPRVRVLVCGGDGTAAWILQSLEELQEVDPKPPVGILPLGTGNDLARVLGWGGGFANDLISELLMQIQEAHPAVLDRWEVNITPQDPGAPPPSPKKKPKEIVEFDHGARKGGRRGKSGNGGNGGSGRGDYSPRPTHDYAAANGAGDGPGGRPMGKSKTLIFQNYLGIGVDAQAALRFHRTRNVRPQLFFSAFTNKLLYGIFGARDFVEHSCAGMHQHVHLIADGVRRELPPETEGIILLNINSFAGGVRMWESSEGYGASSMQDGMVDVVVVYGALHLGQLNWGVDKPVRICPARHVKVIVERGYPMHVDGEPWEQAACTIDIGLRNKALMLRRTADARGMSVVKMADTLEWGQREGVITNEQREVIMTEAYRRAESDRIAAGAHGRSGSFGNLVSRHRRGRSSGSIGADMNDADYY